MWARGHCRISPPRFLAECCKRQLNQGSFVWPYFRLFPFSDLYWVSLSVFSCTVLFVSISQVIGCEDHLRNDLYCVEWGIKLHSNQSRPDVFPVTQPSDEMTACFPVIALKALDYVLCLIHTMYASQQNQRVLLHQERIIVHSCQDSCIQSLI